MQLDMAESLINRHPLQRLPSPSRSASALVHVSPVLLELPVSGTNGLLSSWSGSLAFSGLSNSMVSLPVYLKRLLTCLKHAREPQSSVRFNQCDNHLLSE